MGGFDAVANAIGQDFQDFAEVAKITHVVVRLLMAALLGGLLGYQREKMGKAAGLRTHMLITMGTALFIFIAQFEGIGPLGMARVIQGVIEGVGFLGAGAILKLADEKEIHGLTTAAGIWVTAGIGVAVGFGRLGTAIIATVLALLVLTLMSRFEAHTGGRHASG